ncbi:hypothetical protein [Actinoalloteichus hoggarensis]|uniref:hypothetical protein n=1 Tax=Actinoalloteichus hoggarensis TaxID=1470176 RepID=UPI003CCC03CF
MTQDLTALIRQAYGGDLTRPVSFFIDTQLKQRPYDPVINDLGELGLQLHEFTDPNFYVAFGYKITDDTPVTSSWVLELSMVGRFGVLARTAHNEWHRLLYPAEPDLHPIEAAMLDILTTHQITLPTRQELEQPLEMTLDFTDPENVRVYHALFSDEDLLPWQFSPLYRPS